MHVEQLNPDQAQAMAMLMRLEISDSIKAAAQTIVDTSRQIASHDEQLFCDLLGNGIGLSFVLMIDMLGRKYPQVLNDKPFCIETWLEAITRGITSVRHHCDCDQCKRELL